MVRMNGTCDECVNGRTVYTEASKVYNAIRGWERAGLLSPSIELQNDVVRRTRGENACLGNERFHACYRARSVEI